MRAQRARSKTPENDVLRGRIMIPLQDNDFIAGLRCLYALVVQRLAISIESAKKLLTMSCVEPALKPSSNFY